MTTPQRMCAGCRQREPKTSLARLVWDGGVSVLVDIPHRAPGRGVYLHPECAEQAVRSRAIGRGLRRNLDGVAVRDVLSALPVG